MSGDVADTRLSPLTFSFLQLIHSTGCVLRKRVPRPLSHVFFCGFFKDLFLLLLMQIFLKVFIEFVAT